VSTDQHKPFDVLQRMQQQAAAAGYVLPELTQTEERRHGLGFVVGELRLAADLTAFTDIVDCGAITPVPRTRTWVRGITNVRGSLHSVVDFAQFLGYPRINTDTEGKLLVINDSDLGCALLVNSVLGMRRFDHDNEYQDAEVMSASIQPYVRHAYLQDNQLWGMLDTDKLQASDKFRNVEVED
jgi:twitching motility protein PilI